MTAPVVLLTDAQVDRLQARILAAVWAEDLVRKAVRGRDEAHTRFTPTESWELSRAVEKYVSTQEACL